MHDGNSTSALQPLLDDQAMATLRIRRRRAWLAKLFLVLTTAIFSAFATHTAHYYLERGEVQPLSLVVVALLAAGIVTRWRAV